MTQIDKNWWAIQSSWNNKNAWNGPILIIVYSLFSQCDNWYNLALIFRRCILSQSCLIVHFCRNDFSFKRDLWMWARAQVSAKPKRKSRLMVSYNTLDTVFHKDIIHIIESTTQPRICFTALVTKRKISWVDLVKTQEPEKLFDISAINCF